MRKPPVDALPGVDVGSPARRLGAVDAGTDAGGRAWQDRETDDVADARRRGWCRTGARRRCPRTRFASGPPGTSRRPWGARPRGPTPRGPSEPTSAGSPRLRERPACARATRTARSCSRVSRLAGCALGSRSLAPALRGRFRAPAHRRAAPAQPALRRRLRRRSEPISPPATAAPASAAATSHAAGLRRRGRSAAGGGTSGSGSTVCSSRAAAPGGGGGPRAPSPARSSVSEISSTRAAALSGRSAGSFASARSKTSSSACGSSGRRRAGSRRRLAGAREQHRGLAAPWIHDRAGQAFEGHGGEGVAVGRGDGLPAADDLWGEVGERPDQNAGGRDAIRAAHPGQPEVAEVRVVRLAHEHVLGLHVAMNEAGGVRHVQGIRDLAQEGQGAPCVERALAHQRRQRRP